MEKRTIDISIAALVRVTVFVLGLWFLFFIRDIIVLFILSLILTATIRPLVEMLEKKKIPRSVSVLGIYIILISLLALGISLLVPPLVGQFKEFSTSAPTYIEKINSVFKGFEMYARTHGIDFDSERATGNIFSGLFESTGQIFSTTISVFNGFVSAIVVLSLTFYMSVKKQGLRRFIDAVTPPAYHEYAFSFAERAQNKIGRWVMGQIALMASVFALDFLVLYFANVPYALILAMIGGTMELIPYVGPVIATTIATAVGFLVSPITGLIVLALFTLVHQLEIHMIVPQIMKRAVGLNPIIVILVILIGFKMSGVLGAILAIPVATAIGLFVNDLMCKDEKKACVSFPGK